MQTRVGFTGTSKSLTANQIAYLYNTLKDLKNKGYTELHHGDCIGADSVAGNIACGLGYRIHIHPGDVNPSKRAFTHGDVFYSPMDTLKRNKMIVDFSDVLIACPKGAEVLRSGTWSTIRYAVKKNKHITVIWPSGLVSAYVKDLAR